MERCRGLERSLVSLPGFCVSEQVGGLCLAEAVGADGC